MSSGISLGLAQSLYFQIGAAKRTGWSVFGERMSSPGAFGTITLNANAWLERSYYVPYNIQAIMLGYANWFSSAGANGERTNNSAIRVRSYIIPTTSKAVRSASTPILQTTVNSKPFGYLECGSQFFTDPLKWNFNSGSYIYAGVYYDSCTPPAPTAPTVTPAITGGTLAAGTYYGLMRLVDKDGLMSAPVSWNAVIASGTTGSIVITSPTAVSPWVGYAIYIATGAGGASNQTCYLNGADCTAFGTNVTITSSQFQGNQPNSIYSSNTQALQPYNSGVYGGTGPGSGVQNGDTGEALVLYGGNYGIPKSGGMTGLSTSVTGGFEPSFILAQSSDGLPRPSVVIVGDSICKGVGDTAMPVGGGWINRGLLGITGRLYDSSKKPTIGSWNFGIGGETNISWINWATSMRRFPMSLWGSQVVNAYGTNDVNAGTTSAQMYANDVTDYSRYAINNVWWWKATVPPLTTSTDGWQTVTNQKITTGLYEGYRRAYNNCILDTTGASAITNELLFRTDNNATPGTNYYSGGNGSATVYITAYPLLQGSSSVYVNNVLQTLTTNYTYNDTVIINGSNYASGITFVTAPASGYSVKMNYTKVPGYKATTGGLGAFFAGAIDRASKVEVNSSSNAGVNGGFWNSATSALVPITLSAYSSTQATISAPTVTQDQLAGSAIWVATGTGSGQLVGIIKNSAAGVVYGTFSTVLDGTSVCYISTTWTLDGTHPTGDSLPAMAGSVPVSAMLALPVS